MLVAGQSLAPSSRLNCSRRPTVPGPVYRLLSSAFLARFKVAAR